MPANEDGTHGFDYLKLRREVLSKEVGYRRGKTWRIFSWTSSILLAALGAVIALTGWSQRIPEALAIFILSFYAHVWITQNRKQAKILQEAIKEYDAELDIKPIESDQPLPLGYRVSLLITAASTILVVMFVSGEQP